MTIDAERSAGGRSRPDAPRETTPALDALTRPATIVIVWILHGAAFTLLLLALMPTLAHVDANSADILQKALAPAYQVKNPPIYEWLTLAVQQVTGPGPASFLIVRYALMGLIGVSVYGTVALVSHNRAAAAGASFGLMGFYWFAWYFHDSISHSILVALACVWFLWALVAHLRRPSWRTVLVLAAVTAIGTASKYNFLILVAGAMATMALDRRLRPMLFDWRLVAVPVAVAAFAGPIMLAADSVGAGLVGTLQSHVTGEEPLGVLARIASGGRLVVLYLLFLLPWALVAWVAFGRPKPALPIVRSDDLATVFLVRLAVILPAGAVVLVVLAGVRPESLAERYLFPILFAVPLAAHAVLGVKAGARPQVPVFGGFALAVLVLVFAIRLLDWTTATRPGDENKRFQPFDRLAPLLVERGLGDAFFIAPDRWESGQLNAALPDARAAGLRTQRRWTPMSYPPTGRCVLFWFDRSLSPEEPRPAAVVPEALRAFAPADRRIATIEVPWREGLWGGPRATRFHLIDLGSDAAPCAEVFGRHG